MRIGDCFSGIGGFSYAFTLEGFEVAWACEIDAGCRQIYSMRFPDVPLYEDVRALEDPPWADVWCAGFPCQDLSVAASRGRKGLQGERSGLFFDFVRLVERARPAWLVLENVPGLLSANEGGDMAVVLGQLSDLGYGVAWRVLDAQFFGVPQRRRGVWIVGHLGDLRAGEVLLESEGMCGHPAAGGEAREDIAYRLTTRPGDRRRARDTYVVHGLRRDPGGTGQGWNTNYIVKENQRNELTINRNAGAVTPPHGKSQFVASTLRASDGHHGYSSPRGDGCDNLICTPPDTDRVREAPGVPGRMDAPRYRALGNAVPVPVVAWIARRIRERA